MNQLYSRMAVKGKPQERISAAEARKLLTRSRGSKFGNQTTVKDGKGFESKREADRYQELSLLLAAGLIKDLRTQVPYIIVPESAHGPQLVYIADFVYIDTKTGKEVVEDAKGFKTAVYKLKKRLMAERHGIIIREV